MKIKLAIILIILLSSTTIGYLYLKNSQKTTQPNVIWISLDTQRAQSLDIYRSPISTSPFLKRFAEENIIFNKAYSQSSFTWTSHSSMLTGLYPVMHQMLKNQNASPAHKNVKFAAQYFKELGYETFMAATYVGNEKSLPLAFGLERGFDYILPYDALRVPESTINAMKDALSFKKPFFAFLHTYIVHGPYTIDESYYDKFRFDYKGPVPFSNSDWEKKFGAKINDSNRDDFENFKANNFFKFIDLENPEDLKLIRARYNAAISFEDHQLEALLTELKKTVPNFENTIIVITADHGESLGENKELGHVLSFETNLWVPLILKVPNQSPKRIKAPVRSIDILPSVLELVGGKPDQNIDGKSFVYLFDSPEQPKHFETTFAEAHLFNTFYAIIKDQWKYSIDDNDRERLFNIEKDPTEDHNLIHQETEKALELKSLLLKYQTTPPIR